MKFEFFFCFHFVCGFFVYCVVNCFNNKVRNVGLCVCNVFKILNDHYRLSDEEDILQSIIDDREQEQEDNETDTNNDIGDISFVIEMANIINNEIIKKKGPNRSQELSENLLSSKAS